MPRPRRSESKPAKVAEATSNKLVAELNRAADQFRSADHAIRSHIDDVVSEHPDDILFLSFEDKRALKLYSCGFRCRHCAITKCGVAVWRARHVSGEYCFRYVIPFDWIEDKEDFLVSSLVDTLRKMPRAPSLLVLALPRGCYEAHRPLVLGLAFIMELLKIREVHVFLSPVDDSSFHFADLLRQTEEGECRTVQDVAALPLSSDVVWRTRVNMPLYNIVDVLCTLTTSPIAQPTTTFVLARNGDGAVTYRTTAFLPKVMWKELRWSMQITRMTEERERRALEAPVPSREPTEEPFRPLFASSAEEDDTIMAWERENRRPKRRNPTRQSGGTGRLVIKMEEEEEEEEASSRSRDFLSPPREQCAESDPDSPEVPAKRLRSSSGRKSANSVKASSRSKRWETGLRRVKKEEGERARGGMDQEEEEEDGEGDMEEKEESDDEEDRPPANPHGAVTVFLKTRHSHEQRRAIAAKCRPTLPEVEGRVEELVEELRANGDATEKLIRLWRRMGEKMIPARKDDSLLEALDEISSRMTPISIAHPEWDPEVFFHDA